MRGTQLTYKAAIAYAVQSGSPAAREGKGGVPRVAFYGGFLGWLSLGSVGCGSSATVLGELGVVPGEDGNGPRTQQR